MLNVFDPGIWREVFQEIVGPADTVYLISRCLVMLAGAIVIFGADVFHSTTTNSSTPSKFNFWFMARDNILRAIVVFIVIFTTVLFWEEKNGFELTIQGAFKEGLAIDAITGTVLKIGKSSSPVKKRREKLINRYKN